MARSRARKIILRTLLGLVALLLVGGATAATLLYYSLVADLPPLRSLEDYRPPLTSVVLDRNGNPIGEFNQERRRLIDLDELPPHVVQAFLAAEDKDVLRALRASTTSPSCAPRGRTSRRAARSAGREHDHAADREDVAAHAREDVPRKIQEMILARRLEQR